MIGPENWDRSRDEEWEKVKDDIGMSRDEWEELQNQEDVGYSRIDLDSSDET